MALKQALSDHLQSLLGLDNIVIEIPKDTTLGDFATPIAFSLAKIERKPPLAIATAIAGKAQILSYHQTYITHQRLYQYQAK